MRESIEKKINYIEMNERTSQASRPCIASMEIKFQAYIIDRVGITMKKFAHLIGGKPKKGKVTHKG